MNRAACVVLVMLAGCAADSSGGEPAGTNPPMLWLTMSSGSTQMSLVGEEPRPY